MSRNIFVDWILNSEEFKNQRKKEKIVSELINESLRTYIQIEVGKKICEIYQKEISDKDETLQ